MNIISIGSIFCLSTDATPIEGVSDLRIPVFNQGASTVTDVLVTVTLPDGLAFSTDTPTQGTFDDLSGEWDVGTLTTSQDAANAEYLELCLEVTDDTAAPYEIIWTITCAECPDQDVANDVGSRIIEGITCSDFSDCIISLAEDLPFVHLTGDETIAGIKTFSSDVIVPAEVYGVGWNGSNEVPTKNDVYDKIEALIAGVIADGDYGDVTVSGAGTVITIDNDAVTFAKMQNITSDRLLGRDTAASGNTEEITVGGGIEFTGSLAIQRSALAGGDITAPAGSAVLTIANQSVSYAKIQQVSATDKILGRVSGGAGVIEEITFTDAAQQLADDATFADMRTTLGVALGTDTQPHDATLDSLAVFNTNGILVQTAMDTFTGRTIVGTANELTVTNGNGVAGNPTLSLPTGIDPAKLADGSVSATEFQYLNGVTSAIQTQINTKAADADVVHDTGNETIAGVKTFTSDPLIPDEVYGVGWNGVLEPPTKNAVYDQMELKAVDSLVVHLAGSENITGVKTFVSDPLIPDEAYGVGFNGVLEPVTKNAFYDKMEAVLLNIPSKVYKAVLAQTGTSNPTATAIVANTLGEVPLLVRTGSAGSYEIGTAGTPFTASKTIITATLGGDATAAIVRVAHTATNKITFTTFDAADVAADLVGSIHITIEVWA